MSAATEWANKKKAAMENAKKLREERKSGIGNNAEVPTFTPQVNKRPQYLNNTKDTLDIEVKIQSNDVFEQPLPGARAKQQHQQDLNTGLPSPGSDALGREMRNHPTNNSSQLQMPNVKMSDAQYKSAFLQQYETEKQLRNNNANSYQQREIEQHQPEPYDEFAGMLRSDAGSSGPGWNDDTTSNGFANTKTSKIPSNRHVVKKAPVSTNGYDNQSSSYDNNPTATRTSGMQQPSRIRNVPPQQQQQRQQEWNSDSDYMPAAELPPRVSPRPAMQQSPTKVSPRGAGGGSVANTSNIQHSKLQLLKSKIRNSESSGSSRTNVTGNESQGLFKSSSSSERQQGGAFSDFGDNNGTGGRKTAPVAVNYDNTNSYQDNNQYDYNEQPPPAVAPRAGRRGPPPPQNNVSASTKQQQQADAFKYEQEQYMQSQRQQQAQADENYQPSFKSNAPSRHQAPAKQQHNSRFDEDDDQQEEYNNVVAQKAPSRQQQQQQQPPPRNQQPPSQQQRQPPQQQQYQQPPQQQQYQQPPQQQQQQQRPPPAAAAYNNNMSEYPPGEDMDESMGGADNLQPQHECPDCGRKFNAIPYQKHIKICAKVFIQKRKAFDSTKMRVNDNPELVQILNKVKKEEKKKAQQQAKPGPAAAAANFQNKPVASAADDGKAKWKEQSNAFREAMKAARVYNKAIEKGEAPPPVIAKGPDMSLIPCHNCGRRFNEKAAERHIPLCKNIIAKPNALKRGAGGGGGVNGAPSVATKGRR